MNGNTKYYWKIVAWDNYNESSVGPVWNFTTVNNPPNEPSDPNPEDGETDVDINADLSWNCSDPDGDNLTFDVYFGDTDPPQLKIQNQTESTYDPGPMEYETLYYWKIVAWDEYDASAIGQVWEFTTMTDIVIVQPDDYDIIRGNHISGGLSSLFYSDDSYLVIQYGFTLTNNEPPVWIRITGESPTTDPSVLSFTLESHVTRIGKIGQSIELYNYEDSEYEEIDSRQATSTDQVVQVNITSNPSRFINPSTNEMKAQLKYIQTGPVTAYPWSTKFDQTIWTITN
jgi:hypothetical protein